MFARAFDVMSRQIWRFSSLSLVALLLILAASMGEASTEGPADADNREHRHPGGGYGVTPAQVPGTLRTEADSGIGYAGVFEGSGSSVELRSRQIGTDGMMSPRKGTEDAPGPAHGSVTTADHIEVTVTVNGKRIDVREDLNGGTVRFDPHGQKLVEDDLVALNGAYYDFEGGLVPLMEGAETERPNPLDEHPRLDPDNPLDPQDDLLLRTLMFMSEAPVGVPLKEIEASQPELRDIGVEGQEEAGGEPTFANAFTRAQGDDQAVGLAEAACEDDGKFLPVELVACRNPNDNELYVFGCYTFTRSSQHDDGGHCFRSFRVRSGPDTSSCMARCGKGCGRKNGLGIYTLDCLDHDHVVGHVGYAAPRAQDEFRWTFGDAAYGQNNKGKRCKK